MLTVTLLNTLIFLFVLTSRNSDEKISIKYMNELYLIMNQSYNQRDDKKMCEKKICNYCGEEAWVMLKTKITYDDGTIEDDERCNNCVALLFSECIDEMVSFEVSK